MAFPQSLMSNQPQMQPRKSSFWDFLTGTPERLTNVPLYGPQQQQVQNQLLQGSMAGLGSLQPSFEPIRQQALGTFQEQIVPTLAERFTSLGGSGSRLSSPAFASQIGQAGAGLSRDLAAQEQGFNQQQQEFLRSLLGMGLQRQYEPIYEPQQPGFLQQFLLGGLQQAPQTIASIAKLLPFLL